jgi:hypothetical protein
MSVKLMSMVFERYNAPGNETLLAVAMADHANDSGEGIYPSLATLARKSRQSESTTRRQIKSMLEKGWLIRVNAGHGGRAVTNEYRINPQWIKGVNLEGFPDLADEATSEGPNTPRDPQSAGSSSVENPSTAVTGNSDGNPSKLTPFPPANPFNATGYSTERVSNQPRKGVTAMTPDPSEPKNSDAHAPARRGAREREAENPNPADQALRASTIRGYWHSVVVNGFLESVGLAFPELRRHAMHMLPQRLSDLIRDTAAPIVEAATGAELEAGQRTKELEVQVTARYRSDAEVVVSLYRTGIAA